MGVAAGYRNGSLVLAPNVDQKVLEKSVYDVKIVNCLVLLGLQCVEAMQGCSLLRNF